MNQNLLIDAISYIDEEMIEKHVKMRAVSDAGIRRRQKSHAWIKWTALAACLTLIVSAIPLWALIQNRTEHPETTAKKPPATLPIYDVAYFSVNDIAGLFAGVGTGGTNYYQKINVPDSSYLYLAGIPTAEYLPIYKEDYFQDDEESFLNFVDGRLPNISEAMGRDLPAYEFTVFQAGGMRASVETSDYWVLMAQDPDRNWAFVETKNGNPLVLNGKTVTVDRTKSDKEILLSLSEYREELSQMFGRDFPDAKVVRVSSEYDMEVYELIVFFYDESAHPLNDYNWSYGSYEEPYSDHIEISFNSVYGKNEMENRRVFYQEYRTEVSDFCKPYANAKRISLERAEELLKAGFTFGGHSCDICGRQEETVDFSDYDLVGLTYISGYQDPWEDLGPDNRIIAVPFYVFCKQIGTTSSGYQTYAKIYVPAIEVSGVDEYLRKQEEYHQNYASQENNFTTAPKDEDE